MPEVVAAANKGPLGIRANVADNAPVPATKAVVTSTMATPIKANILVFFN